MTIIPAIDLWEGKVVRFSKGDPNQSTIYSNDPVAMAQKWESLGAKLLHIVDLSAAFSKVHNRDIIKKITKAIKIPIEVGGGIRDISIAKELLDLGVTRIIIGTKGMNAEFLDSLLVSFSKDKIAVSIDAVDSYFSIEGWQKKTNIKAQDAVKFLYDKGISWIIYTDVSKDGMLTGPNLEAMAQFKEFKEINFISSGGVSSLEDLKNIKEKLPFVWGVIVGKALYENKLDFKAALNISSCSF